MDTHPTVGRIVWFRVAIGNFLFVYSGQSIRIIVMGVCIELAQKAGYMVIELFVSRFPSKRHNDVLVDKRGVRDYAGFFVCALVERDS